MELALPPKGEANAQISAGAVGDIEIDGLEQGIKTGLATVRLVAPEYSANPTSQKSNTVPSLAGYCV
jgi:hypothetical protein